MKFLLSLLLFVFLSLETFSQKKETQPFGIRYYGYMPGSANKNMSFDARRAAAKGARVWTFIDVKYKNLVFTDVGASKSYQETNVLFPGAEVKVNIPKGRHLAYFGYSYYLPFEYKLKWHPYFDEARDGTENVTSFSYGYSYVFNIGDHIKPQLLFFNLGVESLTRKLSFDKDLDSDPDELVSPEYSYNLYKIGIGYHFNGPWFFEANYHGATNAPSLISMSLGYRIAIKR